MTSLTVLYCTSNRENPAFEQRVQATLVTNSSPLPIISVSQQPINLGTNICIGDIGASPENYFKQMLIGAEAATTPYICTAEADFLYPPDYFQFRPYRPDMFYLAGPLYVLYSSGRRMCRFYSKRPVEAACIVGRDHLIYSLKHYMVPGANTRTSKLCDLGWRKIIHLSAPIITFKTGNGLHWSTPMSIRSWDSELPYWGSATNVLRRYYENTTI